MSAEKASLVKSWDPVGGNDCKVVGVKGVEQHEPLNVDDSCNGVNLLSSSELLDPELAAEILKELPLRLQYSDWVRAYSTYEDGMTLSSFYRKLAGHADHKEPCLMIVRDSARAVFGCYTTGQCQQRRAPAHPSHAAAQPAARSVAGGVQCAVASMVRSLSVVVGGAGWPFCHSLM